MSILAGVAIAGSVISSISSRRSAKKQKRLAEKQAEYKRQLAKGDYIDWDNASRIDYFRNLQDIAISYSSALSDLTTEFRTVKKDFQASNALSISQMNSSFYQDMKGKIDQEFDNTFNSITTEAKINNYRMQEERLSTTEQAYKQYKQNIESINQGLDAQEMNIKYSAYNTYTNNFLKSITAGASWWQDYQYGKKGDD